MDVYVHGYIEGRLPFWQYMPAKPTKCGAGIKVWELCESKTGYFPNFDVSHRTCGTEAARIWFGSSCRDEYDAAVLGPTTPCLLRSILCQIQVDGRLSTTLDILLP